MTGRHDGSLIYLQSTASTARTLNLLSAWRRHGDSEAYAARPFFQNAALNKCILVKHRLHRDERSLFEDGRYQGIKVILPIDIADLRSGAWAFYVGQRGYEDLLTQVLTQAERAKSRDVDLLELIATISSLDPFILRERLKAAGYAPAQCYFDITEGDAQRMLQFVCGEVRPLVIAGYGPRHENSEDLVGALAAKILSNDAARELEPLRVSLEMELTAFEEGLFCWKGFMYYKWALLDLLPKLAPMMSAIASSKSVGPVTDEQRGAISAHRAALPRAISTACADVRQILKVYSDAFTALTQNGHPATFRAFLLAAPGMFNDLGDRLGAVQHVVGFWNDRFPGGVQAAVPPIDMIDIFTEFESALTAPVADVLPDIPILAAASR